MREPNVNGLMAFLYVVEHGSFTRAAGHLGVSISAISQRVRKLEKEYGLRLLNRTTRNAQPTAEGIKLANQVRAAVRNIGEATQVTYDAAGKIGGHFHLTVSAVAASLVIAPHVGGFRRQHPDLHLAISVSERRVNLVEEGLDAGLRRGDLIGAEMVSHRVSPDAQMLVVASPNYLAGRQAIDHPNQLRRHDCITVNRLADGSVPPWRFEHQGVSADIKIERSLVVDTPVLALEAAVNGAGLAYLASDYVAPAIRVGSLMPVLREWSVTRSGFFLYYPKHQHTLPAARAFSTFVRSNSRLLRSGVAS